MHGIGIGVAAAVGRHDRDLIQLDAGLAGQCGDALPQVADQERPDRQPFAAEPGADNPGRHGRDGAKRQRPCPAGPPQIKSCQKEAREQQDAGHTEDRLPGQSCLGLVRKTQALKGCPRQDATHAPDDCRRNDVEQDFRKELQVVGRVRGK